MDLLTELLPRGIEQNVFPALIWGFVTICGAYCVAVLVGILMERRAGKGRGISVSG